MSLTSVLRILAVVLALWGITLLERSKSGFWRTIGLAALVVLLLDLETWYVKVQQSANQITGLLAQLKGA